VSSVISQTITGAAAALIISGYFNEQAKASINNRLSWCWRRRNRNAQPVL